MELNDNLIKANENIQVNNQQDKVNEFRYNEFEDVNSSLDGFGIAGGLQFKF